MISNALQQTKLVMSRSDLERLAESYQSVLQERTLESVQFPDGGETFVGDAWYDGEVTKIVQLDDGTYEVTIQTRVDCKTCAEWDPRMQNQCDTCGGRGYISTNKRVVALDKEGDLNDNYPEGSSWEAFDVTDTDF